MKITEFAIGKKYKAPFWPEGVYVMFDRPTGGSYFLMLFCPEASPEYLHLTPMRLNNDWVEVEEEAEEQKDKYVEEAWIDARSKVIALRGEVYELKTKLNDASKKLEHAILLIKESRHVMNWAMQFNGDPTYRFKHRVINEEIINFLNRHKG